MTTPAVVLGRARAAAAVAAGDYIPLPIDPASGTVLVTVASPGTDRTATGTLGLVDTEVRINSQGTSTVSVSWTNGLVFTGTIVAEVSNDAGVSWDGVLFIDQSGANPPALTIAFPQALPTDSRVIDGGGFGLTRVRASVGGGVTTLPVAMGASTAVNEVNVTGLPRNAALADATANPNLTQIGSFPHGFNAATWDRLRAGVTAAGVPTGYLNTVPTGRFNAAPAAVAEGQFAPLQSDANGRLIVGNLVAWLGATTPTVGQKANTASLPVVVASDQLPLAAVLADATANPTLSQIETFPAVFGGATWDRLRGGVTGVSAATGFLNALAGLMFNAAAPAPVAGQTVPAQAASDGGLVVTGGPARAALGDAIANPTTATIGANLLGFNAAAGWQRIRAVADNEANVTAGKLATVPARANAAVQLWTEGAAVPISTPLNGALRIDLASAGGTTAAAMADNAANPTTPPVAAYLVGFDGATWDRVRVGVTAAGTPTGFANALACGVFNTAAPAPTNGQALPLQSDARGRLISGSNRGGVADNGSTLQAGRVAVATIATLTGIRVKNSTNGVAGTIMVFDSGVAVNPGTIPLFRAQIGAAGSEVEIDVIALVGAPGFTLSGGCYVALSTTDTTFTIGAATCIFDTYFADAV